MAARHCPVCRGPHKVGSHKKRKKRKTHGDLRSAAAIGRGYQKKSTKRRRPSNPGFLPGGNEMKGFLVLENAEDAAREISARLGKVVHVNVQKSTGRYVLSPKKNTTTIETYGAPRRRRSRY